MNKFKVSTCTLGGGNIKHFAWVPKLSEHFVSMYPSLLKAEKTKLPSIKARFMRKIFLSL